MACVLNHETIFMFLGYKCFCEWISTCDFIYCSVESISLLGMILQLNKSPSRDSHHSQRGFITKVGSFRISLRWCELLHELVLLETVTLNLNLLGVKDFSGLRNELNSLWFSTLRLVLKKTGVRFTMWDWQGLFILIRFSFKRL